MTTSKALISKRFRPLVRHPEARGCAACLWLNTHARYESEYTCGDEDCLGCFFPRANLPVKKLRQLKRSTSEFAIAADLNIDPIERQLCQDGKLDPCIARWAQEYLAHVLRNGDCLSLYVEHERNDGVIIYYNREFHCLEDDPDECGNLPLSILPTLVERIISPRLLGMEILSGAVLPATMHSVLSGIRSLTMPSGE
jgi:hypothetical protein